jgi:hypothetical protein
MKKRFHVEQVLDVVLHCWFFDVFWVVQLRISGAVKRHKGTVD